MTDLPRGTMTFLFTDIEGSSALWERDHQAMVNAVPPKPRMGLAITATLRRRAHRATRPVRAGCQVRNRAH